MISSRLSAARPLAARAQQSMPVIGWLSSISEQTATRHRDLFLRGLGETGFAPGRNLAIQYSWSEGQYDRLPTMAADLIGRPVDLILAQGPPAASFPPFQIVSLNRYNAAPVRNAWGSRPSFGSGGHSGVPPRL